MKNLALVALAIVILIAGFLIFNRPQIDQPIPQSSSTSTPSLTTQKMIEIKASFKIITNGTTRIFTDPKYHNLSDDVFIQLPDASTVHVTKVGITWDDFFKTLPMKLTKDCLTTGTNQQFCTGGEETLKFYLNDKEDKNLLDRELKMDDKILIEFISH